MEQRESEQRFSSRSAFLMSALGIAVGTGNIWRFPRIAATNGGDEGAGAFLVAWVIFLFLWSIPLIIAEYIMGRKSRKGTVVLLFPLWEESLPGWADLWVWSPLPLHSTIL